uniref:Uncharacterized protein n=1 Tax=Anguilla anguilla TaxID=7936 RepID=A0A0E9TMW9_ANGAN
MLFTSASAAGSSTGLSAPVSL